MEQLIGRIRQRLAEGAYQNEAAVSVGILMPILRSLGWDETDPSQVAPEYSSGRGRVDFALCTPPRRPAVFVEVKGVGRSVEGDRQLFEYAFHEGVPLCVLTDGREWSFYLPGGQGSYDDRRVYRLQLDERPPEECARVFQRYLACDRVRSGKALEDASTDYREAAARREAARALPQAWGELVSEPEELLLELLADRAEAICGYRPSRQETVTYLHSLNGGVIPDAPSRRPKPPQSARPAIPNPQELAPAAPPIPAAPPEAIGPAGAWRGIQYQLFGAEHSAANANVALVDILRTLALRDPAQIEALAKAVQGRSRNHIARSAAEIYPARPDLARAAEFAPGWLVGLNIANREKASILRAACEAFGAKFGQDVIIELPNAGR